MADSEKIDLFKEHKADYKATSRPALIETAAAHYLAVEGQGAPGGPEFEDRIGALYSMAFTIKMTRKAAGLGDYVVCKLESLWYAPDGGDDLCRVPPEQWCWTLMIRTPDGVTSDDLDAAVKALRDKGKCEFVQDVRLITLDEGPCVQMLHIGPYEMIGDTIETMQAFAARQGLAFTGNPHDIYLSDPRRVAPEKLKTIVRRPVKQA